MVKVRVKKFGAAKAVVPQHPEARKVKQQARKDLRKVKITRERGDRNRQKQPLLKKCLFFQRKVNAAAADKSVWDEREISELIRQYIGRFDKELEAIGSSKRAKYGQAGKHQSREELLKAEIRKEIDDFAAGAYEAPDLTDARVVLELRKWNGSVHHVAKITMRSFKDAIGGEISSMPGFFEYDDDGNTVIGDDDRNLNDLDDDDDDDDDAAANDDDGNDNDDADDGDN